MERRLQLQPRLALLAELVPEGCRLADIGTDHGYLPVYLMQQRRIAGAIAADIGPEPLEHARRTAMECGVENVEFRLCDGLQGIRPEEVDTVVIAGMGGETILSILEAAEWTRTDGHTLLLQPMTKAAELRRWLSVNGYTFTGERLVWDKGFLYPVLCVTGGTFRELTEAEALTGVMLEDDPLYGAYLAYHAERLRRTAAGLRRSDRAEVRQQAEQAEVLARTLEEKRSRL